MKSSRIAKFILVFALMFNLFAAAAFAKTSRSALVTSVSGDVSVTKGGGSNPIPAFPNMPLNQGDTITTGEASSVTLKIADPESERTIGANSEITISELTADASGKKSGFKVWVGSMWNKVKSLATGDEDSVDTPTATMGVRGTIYYVTVNADGSLSMVVASGFVASQLTGGLIGNNATGNNTGPSDPVLVSSTQQLEVNPAAPPSSLENAVKVVDVTKVVSQSDPSILRAFVIDAPAIAAENTQIINDLSQIIKDGKTPVVQRGNAVSGLSIKNLDDLNKLAGNANNLVSNIAAKALELNKVSATELNNLIQQANGQITDTNKKVDVNNVKPLDPTAGVDPQTAQQKQSDQDRVNQQLQQQQQDRQRQQDQASQQLAALLTQVADQQKQLDEQNKKAQDDLNKKAEDNFVSGLSDQEKKGFEDNKKGLDVPNNPTQPTPTPTPTPTPPPTPTSDPGNSDPTPPPITPPTDTPKVTINKTNITGGFQLDVSLSNFTGSNKIYGAELHFLSDDFRQTPSDLSYGTPVRNLDKFPAANSVDIIKAPDGVVGGVSKIETIYAITRFNSPVAVEFGSTSTKLVSIPFKVTKAGSFHVQLAYILLVDQNGNAISGSPFTGVVDGNGKDFTFVYTPSF